MKRTSVLLLALVALVLLLAVTVGAYSVETIEGTINASAYTGQEDGKPHASLEMTANEVEFLSSRGDAQDGGQSAGNAAQTPVAPQNAPYPAAAPAAASPAGFTEVDTDELPF